MRFSEFALTTLKEVPADAEIVSHKLMLRAGLIRRLSSGLFTWMPLGLRVLRKVEAVVREEMDRAGALELLMPAVQPSELWIESGRWDQYGPLLLRMQDEQGRIVLPGAFLSAVERYNLSARLDNWVIRNAFDWLVVHPECMGGLDLISINLSGHSLGDNQLMGHIIERFKEGRIPPEKVCMEITETAAITNLTSAKRHEPSNQPVSRGNSGT